MKYLILFFILTLSFNSYSCEIELNKFIYYLNKNELKKEHIIKSSNCSRHTNSSLVNLIRSSKVKISYLKNVWVKGLQQNILINNNEFHLINLDQLIRKQLKITRDIFIDFDKQNSTVITKNKNLEVNVNCSQCNRLGRQSISLSFKDGYKVIDRKWLKPTFKKKIKGFVSTHHIKPRTDLKDGFNISLKEILVDNEKNIVREPSILKYSVSNKNISRNLPIRTTDIISVPIVKVGMPANVILKSEYMKLSDKAMPLESGKFGQTIRLRNQRSKKVITGKVVDYNKVMVTL